MASSCGTIRYNPRHAPTTAPNSLFFYLFIALTACACFYIFYLPYYHQRSSVLKSHQIFLQTGHCPDVSKANNGLSLVSLLEKVNSDLADKMREIHYEQVRVKDSVTNCKIADSYVNTPVWLGAFSDMWFDSALYSLLTAQTFYTQVLYGITFIAGVLTLIYQGLNQIYRIISLRMLLNKQYPEKQSRVSYVEESDEEEEEDTIQPSSRETIKVVDHTDVLSVIDKKTVELDKLSSNSEMKTMFLEQTI